MDFPGKMVFTGLLFLIGSMAQAQDFQSLDVIRGTVEAYLSEQLGAGNGKSRISIQSNRLDPRLRLVACTSPLAVHLQSGERIMGSVTVGVRCSTPKPWMLYVQADVKAYAPVLVAARTLRRGGILAAEDMELREMDLSRLGTGYIHDYKEVVGMSLRRPVRLGAVISPGLVAPPKIVNRGDRVFIQAKNGSFEVRMQGQALQDGAKGAIIRVRNLGSKREISAEVVGAGLVAVQM
ncbi:MAG: flagellar basal body P-ring formation protein FlgA [Gammaproteobacteria bacterium]|nr:flagellar basal body P-ring formation protein FlgA [Gammaproteobacteria bacterium]